MALKVNNRLWLISDTHFGHKNIIKYQQRPESHDVIMLGEWIRLVPETAQILHLGDVFLGKQGNPARWALVCGRLPGEKYLIKGNHDKQKDSVYESAGFTIVEPFVYKGYAFTHEPLTQERNATFYEDWHTNIHGHIHGNELGGGPGVDFDPPVVGKHYHNISVEKTEFRPVQFGQLRGKR